MIERKKLRNSFSVSNRKNENIKVFANKQEKLIAKENGLQLTPNSGATPFMKADMFDKDSVLDVKSAKGKQIIVTEDMLYKLEQDAIRIKRRQYGLILNFPNANNMRNKKWLLIPI